MEHQGRETALDTYEPIQRLKPIDDNLWLVDGPLITFKGVPFPTRMTIVRLSSGGLFIHSPIALTEPLKQAIDQLGTVEHLVSPNKIHYWWVGEWGKVYPKARKWASPGARPAAQKQGWDFDCDLGDMADPAWAEDIDQLIVKGGRFMEEVVFFHRKSRTLILADLIENFECHKLHSPLLRWFTKLAGNQDPDGKLPIDLRLTYWGRHDQLRTSVESMLAWQPEKIIMAHGRWYDANGVAELRRAFRWVKGIDAAE